MKGADPNSKSVEYCDDCRARFEAGSMQSVVGMLKSHDCPGPKEARVEGAAQDLNDCPLTEAIWCPVGQEGFHPDVGEYWKPAHVSVSGDMTDPAVLKVISKVCDRYSLKVHDHHAVECHNDEWARLVTEKPEGESL